MKNQHFIKIFSYCSKNMWLLIFPLIRGLMTISIFDFDGLYHWFEGAWFDLLIILVIFIAGVVRWKFSRFEVKDDRIIYSNGIFLKTVMEIPYNKITSFSIENQFFMRFIGAADVYIDTSSGKFGDNDLKITVSKRIAFSIKNSIRKYVESNHSEIIGECSYKYKPKWKNIFFFSFIFSSTLTGVIYISFFFIKSGKIIEEILQEKMIDKLSDVSKNLAQILPVYISPVTITIALFFIGSWLISFIMNIFKYSRFKISVYGKIAEISTGILTKRHYYINNSKINYIDLRQSIVTKIAKVMSINVNCSGYGNTRKEIPVIIPLMHEKFAVPALKAMIPDSPKPKKLKYKPSLRFLWRYSWRAVILCAVWVLLYIAADYFFPVYHSAYVFLLVMAEIPSVWYLIVCIVSNCTSGISHSGDSICIKYSRGYVFHTVLADKNRIVKSVISQNIFQKATHTCDIIIYANSEQTINHCLKSIKYSEAMEIQSFLTS